MPNPFHSAMPLALLTCFAFAGCDSSTTEDTTPEVETASEVSPPSSSTPEAATTTEGTDQASTDGANAPKQPTVMDKIKGFLEPDVIGPGLEQNIGKVQEALAGITDEVSANEALPKLNQISIMMVQISAFKKLVPPESGPIIVEKLQAASGPLQESIEKLYENEKVEEILGPTITKITTNFEDLLNEFATEIEADSTETDEPAETEEPAETDEPEAEPAE